MIVPRLREELFGAVRTPVLGVHARDDHPVRSTSRSHRQTPPMGRSPSSNVVAITPTCTSLEAGSMPLCPGSKAGPECAPCLSAP